MQPLTVPMARVMNSETRLQNTAMNRRYGEKSKQLYISYALKRVWRKLFMSIHSQQKHCGLLLAPVLYAAFNSVHRLKQIHNE